MRIDKECLVGILGSRRFRQFLCMIAGGVFSVGAAAAWDKPYFVEVPFREVLEERAENPFLDQAGDAGETMEDTGGSNRKVAAAQADGTRENGMAGKLEKTEDGDDPGRFNFVFYFDEGALPGDVTDSYGGRVYQQLLKRDASWMAGIYGLRHVSPENMAARLGMDKSAVMGIPHLWGAAVDGQEKACPIPSWNRFQVTFRNGDGTAVMGHSNIKEILSIASVYGYFNEERSYDFLQAYADRLWSTSHSYKVSVSSVYYCQGECLYGEKQEDASQTAAAADGQGMDSSGGTAGTEVFRGAGQASPETAANGQVSHEPIPASAAAPLAEEGNPTEGVISQEAAAMLRDGESDLQTVSETFAGSGQISHEPIPASEDGRAGESSGQISHEPILASGGQSGVNGQGSSGQVSHEPIPASEGQEGNGQGNLGQVSHEPIPASAGESQDNNAVLPEPSPDSTESESAREGGGEVSESDVRRPAKGEERSTEAASAARFCQGHIDLNVSAVILGMDGKKSLFTQAEEAGKAAKKGEGQTGWNGWDNNAVEWARAIAALDWYEEYGLTGQDTMFVHNPLSGSEVDSYMEMLPEDTSPKRRKVVKQALLSIGCIPYYWGGKPSSGGFEGNHFGTVVSPDEDGRILKGLDCSGWINWVYWTALGSRLSAESTSGLMSLGRAVEKENLQAGDILIRAGDQPHVYLFLGWAENGAMYLIHETTGNVNNVTIGVYDLDLPYYRCLINEG